MKKRILAMLAAMAIVLSLAACAQNSDADVGRNDLAGSGKIFTEDTTINIMIPTDSSWPYREDWPIWQLFREKTGANLQVLAIPTEYATKINLTMAGGVDQFPDMIFMSYKDVANSHGEAGGFLAISDNLDKMPNYVDFWENIPDGERREAMLQRMAGDGKIYMAPNYGNHTIGNTRTWMYRKDIFEKNGLKAPETMDELYEVSKKLKEIYPESYPFCMRNGLYNIKHVIGTSWAPYFEMMPYYNFDEEKWHFGVLEPEAKEIVLYFKKMVDEGLIMPDFLDGSNTTWEQYVSNDMGFIMADYLLRIDFFNVPAREENPEFMLDTIMPPKASSAKGQNKIANHSYELCGYVIPNSGDETRINNAFKLLDWMYSPEGIETLSWGKEGVTYNVIDGNRVWITDENTTPYSALGIGTPGTYQIQDIEANEALYSKEQVESGHAVRKYQEDRSNPFNFITFPSEIATEVSDIKLVLTAHIDSMLTKFIVGQEPIEKWDAFVEEVKELGADELLKAYEDWYSKAIKLDIAG